MQLHAAPSSLLEQDMAQSPWINLRRTAPLTEHLHALALAPNQPSRTLFVPVVFVFRRPLARGGATRALV